MSIAVSHHPAIEPTVHAPAPSAARVARVEVFDRLVAVEPLWRRLEQLDAMATPYQRYDLLAAWQHHVGSRSGVAPFVVVGFDAVHEPLFLWPLGRSARGPLHIVRFLGFKHANFNIGLWRRDALATLTLGEIELVLSRLRQSGHCIDLLALLGQPLTWNGARNPLMLLPHQASVDMSARLTLLGQSPNELAKVLGASTRSRLRTKERKLQKLAGYRYLQATTATDIDRLLDRFFALKSRHMAAQGLGNVFARAGVGEFLREAGHRVLPSGRNLVEIHALESSDEVLALFGVTVDGYRASSMFNTYTTGEHARYSPGLILLVHMINGFAARGVDSFDLGVGRAHYKTFFCREPEPLFDVFVPFTALGRLAALAFGATCSTKRWIKHNPALWAGVQALRHIRAGAAAHKPARSPPRVRDAGS